MPAQVRKPSPPSRAGVGTCPHCGQRLLGPEAVRRLRESELELERKLEAAVRSIVADLTKELAGEAPLGPGEPEPAMGKPDAVNAAEQRALRLVFRQF
jgi:hypothetical protein